MAAQPERFRNAPCFLRVLLFVVVSSEYENDSLAVDISKFKTEMRRYNKYHTILQMLPEYGFKLTGYNPKAFGKDSNYFYLTFPDMPEMIKVLWVFCRGHLYFKQNRIIKDYVVFHPGLENLDYKSTADWNKLPMLQKVKDFVYLWGKAPATFYIKFYEYSVNYPQVIFDLSYYYKKTRIVKIDSVSETNYILRLKLNNIARYNIYIESLPESIKEVFLTGTCQHCKPPEKKCGFKIQWEHNNQTIEFCSHGSFYFNNPKIEDIPYYFKLLELEYGLTRND